jgi:hypothetical protein
MPWCVVRWLGYRSSALQPMRIVAWSLRRHAANRNYEKWHCTACCSNNHSLICYICKISHTYAFELSVLVRRFVRPWKKLSIYHHSVCTEPVFRCRRATHELTNAPMHDSLRRIVMIGSIHHKVSAHSHLSNTCQWLFSPRIKAVEAQSWSLLWWGMHKLKHSSEYS